MTNLTAIDFADIVIDLRDDADAPAAEWTGWMADYAAATVANQCFHIIHHAGSGRGGIVFFGSGSSDVTSWTDARHPEEVLSRYLADDMDN